MKHQPLGDMMDEEQKSQLDRFKEAAREIGTDDDEAKFNDKLVKQKPEPKDDRADD